MLVFPRQKYRHISSNIRDSFKLTFVYELVSIFLVNELALRFFITKYYRRSGGWYVCLINMAKSNQESLNCILIFE